MRCGIRLVRNRDGDESTGKDKAIYHVENENKSRNKIENRLKKCYYKYNI